MGAHDWARQQLAQSLQDAAEHLGVNVTRVKVLTFATSSVLMGATGAVMATRFRSWPLWGCRLGMAGVWPGGIPLDLRCCQCREKPVAEDCEIAG